MSRQFNVPAFYKSRIISTIKEARRIGDPRKKELAPSVLDFGPVRFKIARHFGFCYGVENAVEIAYRALEENPGKRIFLISEMIHNQRVNQDLVARGIRFLRSTSGEQLIDLDLLTPDDVVIIPAFGVSLEVEAELSRRGVTIREYDTTCPFVVKVWKRSAQIGEQDYTVIVHGKYEHEETRATFSRARQNAQVLVIKDLEEAHILARVIRGERGSDYFIDTFANRFSAGFDPEKDLVRIGVVNQTTMLATETQEIAELLKRAMAARFGEESLDNHFADTRDTLCYATNENQDATRALIDSGADLAIVVGGYNSSNTSHLVELCEEELPTYFISGAEEFDSPDLIKHFFWDLKKETETKDWFPMSSSHPVEVILTSGASCPDSLLDDVLLKIVSWFPEAKSLEEAMAPFDGTLHGNRNGS